MVKKNKKFIYFIYIIIITISFIIFLLLSINTKKEFYLTREKLILLHKKSQEGDIKAIDKLYKYYHYSINDYNKSIYILKMGVKFNDPVSQYRLSMYYLRDYYPYGQKESFKGEGLYLLKQSAKQNYYPAIKELQRINEQKK